MEKKISIAISGELNEALECVSIAQGLSRSRVIENLLREHPVIQKEIQIIREEPNTGILATSKKIVKKLKQNKTKLATRTSS